jgi:hypothetical protein
VRPAGWDPGTPRMRWRNLRRQLQLCPEYRVRFVHRARRPGMRGGLRGRRVYLRVERLNLCLHVPRFVV